MGKYTESDLRSILAAGENASTEFKGRVFPDGGNASKILASFANMPRGGLLIIGYNELAREIVGCDVGQCQKALKNVECEFASQPGEHPIITSQVVSIDGKELFLVEVQPLKHSVFFLNGEAYMRIGDSTVSLKSGSVPRRMNRNDSNEELGAIKTLDEFDKDELVKMISDMGEMLSARFTILDDSMAKGSKSSMKQNVFWGVLSAALAVLFFVLGKLA